MREIRQGIHEEIDRMTDSELLGLKKFVATFPDRLGAVLRNVPVCEEPLSEEDRLALAEADEWLKQNGGTGIPHEQVMRELGLE